MRIKIWSLLFIFQIQENICAFSLKNWEVQISTHTKFEAITYPKILHLNNTSYSKYVKLHYNYMSLIALSGGIPSHSSATARTELRELDNFGKLAYWNSNIKKIMYVDLAIMSLPKIKPSIMISQIKFKTTGSAMMVFVKSNEIYIATHIGNIRNRYTICSNYKLGQRIQLKYVVNKGRISVYYSNFSNMNKPIVSYKTSFTNSYFKVGNYLQSPSPPEKPNSTYEVRLYNVKLG